MVSYKADEGAAPLLGEIPYQFSGETVSLHQGYLIWLPFFIPNREVSHVLLPSHMTVT